MRQSHSPSLIAGSLQDKGLSQALAQPPAPAFRVRDLGSQGKVWLGREGQWVETVGLGKELWERQGLPHIIRNSEAWTLRGPVLGSEPSPQDPAVATPEGVWGRDIQVGPSVTSQRARQALGESVHKPSLLILLPDQRQA